MQAVVLVLLSFVTATVVNSQDTNRYGLSALLDDSGYARIPPGEFTMGSASGKADEQPVRRVVITKAFQMSKFEVTQAQWEAATRRAHSKTPEPEANNPSHFKGANLPVDSVTWQEVQQFLKLLNVRDEKHQYRLPTEAEWEYACRAGSPDDPVINLDTVAWYEPNSSASTKPVGMKNPNAWGLYDMRGNVAEWVQDWYGETAYQEMRAQDPAGPAAGSYKVFRGGSWLSQAVDVRPAARGFNFPNDRYYSVGFRVVRTQR